VKERGRGRSSGCREKGEILQSNRNGDLEQARVRQHKEAR